ncbi:Sin4p KNAG_0F00790 [Huiozyma naganishii CBS 8797]|uniref:Mediator of RNA polymerase II transcription subunit 16 n=1 Tax=Huiozyma naganishii (strain ATCC MYA-139 / BCRC 22969 / CBS 8797 / KCTC 17520 / NBRC 10181 / NCYC 3082 / Yp74L-3) TaxID=1071383 RepID=J7RMG6_HUIN7|nr:hypothetical protein KNAG_0F00790 [Kazachstania naganishii CBS 8797]CCK70748.1 hypothetical protein KNAG_0F00790 [Kazachstania naganishii CBS 8797]
MSSTLQNKTSWSKNGIIAYGDFESPESNLCITFLETINGVNWRLHPPQRYVIYPQLHETSAVPETATASSPSTLGAGTSTVSNASSKSSASFFYNISSVHWNNWFSLPGDMLAVCDELGNMTMLISGQGPEGISTYDKLTMLFQDNIYKIHNHVMPLSPITKINKNLERKKTKKQYHTTILDFHWISSSKNIIVSQFCALDTTINTYRNKAQQIPPFGVFHPPFMKYACVAVRRNGQIDFWYQFSNSKDHKKITLQLAMSHTQRFKELDWLRFANITPMDKGHCMLVTTYSQLTHTLSFYKLNVSWNANAAKSAVLSDPTLKIQHILTTSINNVDERGNVLELTNLHVVSKSSSSEKDHHPEVILVYHVVGTGESLMKRIRLMHTYLAPDYLSILKPDYWEQQQKQVNGRGNDQSVNPKAPLKTNRYNIRYYSDMILNGKISFLSSEVLDGFVTLYFENGDIQVFNSSDWELETKRLVNQVKEGKFTNIITSVISTGLNFPKLPSLIAVEWINVSPTMSGVILKKHGVATPEFHSISRDDVSDPQNDVVDATAFAFAFVGSIHRQLSTEDLSVAFKTHILKLATNDEKRAAGFIMALMKSIYPFFNVSLGAPRELMEKMVSSRPIQKIMLLQMELGNGLKEEQDIAEMARIVLFLKNVLFSFNGVARNIQFAIEQMNNGNGAGQMNSGKLFQTAFSKQDLIHSLIPIAKWFVKFVAYLMQEVLLLINSSSYKSSSLVFGVFGSKMCRQLILSILTEIKKVVHVISKFPETVYPILNESSNYLKVVLKESPVDFEKFETFLINVNNKLTAVGEDQTPEYKENIINREHSLLVKAEIPEKFANISAFLVAYSKNTLLSNSNAASIYFTDTSGLRISQNEFFVPEVNRLLQPIEEGLVLNSEQLSDKFKNSLAFSQPIYDGITYDKFSEMELNDGKMKRCSRCGCLTRAGYPISHDKTIIPTSYQTKRWPAMYTRFCICSGLLYEV